MSTFLPLRLLNCSFPPLVLSSSKSGAFSPTSRAKAKRVIAKRKETSNKLSRVVLAGFILSLLLSLRRKVAETIQLIKIAVLISYFGPQCQSPIWGFFKLPHPSLFNRYPPSLLRSEEHT